MRRLIAIVSALLLLLTCVPACAESTIESVKSETEKKLASLTVKDKGWQAEWLADLQLVSEEEKDGQVVLTYSYPVVESGVQSTETGWEDPAAFLKRALDEYIRKDTLQTFTVIASVSKGKVKFDKKHGPAELRNAVLSAAASAKAELTRSNITDAIKLLVIPNSGEMTAKKVQEAPTIYQMDPAYAAVFAQTMGCSEADAGVRLAPLMMLMSVKDVNLSKGMRKAELTVNVRSSSGLVNAVERLVMEQLDVTVGAPDLTRDQIMQMMQDNLPAAVKSAYYSQKNKQVKWTLDLPSALSGNLPDACPGLNEVIMGYAGEWERAADRLLASAAQREFFVPMTEPATGSLTGTDKSALTDSVKLLFELGNDTENNAWVSISQTGTELITGYVHQGEQMSVRLLPGKYTVTYGKGTDWFGTEYLFGEKGEYGTFEIELTRLNYNKVTLYDDNGPLTVTPVTWESLCGR